MSKAVLGNLKLAADVTLSKKYSHTAVSAVLSRRLSLATTVRRERRSGSTGAPIGARSTSFVEGFPMSAMVTLASAIALTVTENPACPNGFP